MSEPASSWGVLQWAAIALLVALVLPYLLPAQRRHRGSLVRLILALAVGLALAATGAETTEMDVPAEVLQLAAVLALVSGAVGLGGLILFDLLLPAVRVDVPSLVRDVAQVGVATLVVLICLRLAGLDIIPLVTTSAVLTAVIGLALQATIANVFGGLALQLDRTLGQGDWIQTGSHSGRIVEIGWRATRLITKDGNTLFLPNSQLVSGEVLNLSRPAGGHRTTVRLNVHNSHPPSAVRAALVAAIRDVPGVLAYPPPDCVIADFADSTVVYVVRYWLTEFERDVGIAGDVRARLWYAARRAGFESPPPVLRVTGPDADGAARADLPAPELAERTALLHAVELLAPLDEDARERLARRMRRLDFTALEPIVRQGTRGNSLYVVARGEVGVRVEAEASLAEVATLGPGQIFGEMALLTDDPRVATCTARTEVTCYRIDRAAFEDILEARPEIAEHFSATLAARQAALAAQREGLSAAARARVEADQRSRLLDRMRDLFGIS